MREIAVGIAGRRDALVHLEDVHLLPGKPRRGQRAQHQPGRAAAADRHDEAPARCTAARTSAAMIAAALRGAASSSG